MFQHVKDLVHMSDNLSVNDWANQIMLRDQAIVELYTLAQRLNLVIAQTHDSNHYAETCKHPDIEKYTKLVEGIKHKNAE